MMYDVTITNAAGRVLHDTQNPVSGLFNAARWVTVQGFVGFSIDDIETFLQTGMCDVWDEYTGDLCFVHTYVVPESVPMTFGCEV